MTLLKAKDIDKVVKDLFNYNEELIKKTGVTLAEIAAYAVGKVQSQVNIEIYAHKIAIVPISCGEGIISGFSETVKSIIDFLGFGSFVTENKDIAGIEEAYNKRADIIFLADDNNFIAINTATRKIVDNGEATGRGYAAALDLSSGGIAGKEVLILGAGPVGTGAALYLEAHKAIVYIYDLALEKAEKLRMVLPDIIIQKDLKEALSKASLILDATPAADIIQGGLIRENVIISAPGIPLGVEQDCIPLVSERLIHDVLEIGVATMLFEAIFGG